MKVLTSLPPACESPAADPAKAFERRLGKLAFESPALLGGAAARMGLSCSSCHLNGRGNPDFSIAGVSGEPGTADVTSSIFSKVRGDGTMNPVVIPDLALRDGKQIKDRTGAEFRAKVRGLVVEEFDGQEPPPQVFAALLAYLDGLTPSACTSAQRIEVDPQADLDASRLAYEAAQSDDLDAASRLFYVRVARARLERIAERYAAAEHAGLRRRLEDLSGVMGEHAVHVRAARAVAAAQPDWNALAVALAAAKPHSLYDAGVLRDALER